MRIPSFNSYWCPSRRELLSRVIRNSAYGVAIAGSGVTVSRLSAPSRLAPAVGLAEWDDSWTDVVRHAAHKCAIDMPTIGSDNALDTVTSVMDGYEQVLGARPPALRIVLVIRHDAAATVLDDAMWAKYDLASFGGLKDPTTGDPARRNPILQIGSADAFALGGADQALAALQSRSVIMLGCAKALNNLAFSVAHKAQTDATTVKADFQRHVITGVFLQPNGLYALLRAQEAGCAVIGRT